MIPIALEMDDLTNRVSRFLLAAASEGQNVDAPASVRRIVNIRQLTERTRLSVMMSIVGSITAVSTYYIFLNRRSELLSTSAFLVILAGYITLFTTAKRWQSKENKNESYEKYAKTIQLLLVILGSSWGVMVVSGVFFGNNIQRSVAYMLGIGLVSTTMIPGPARYALSFWVPITLISLGSIVVATSQFHIAIFVVVLAFSYLTIYTILTVNSELSRREYSSFLINAHAQTIDMLLRDFQEGSGAFLWETDFAGTIKGLPKTCWLVPEVDEGATLTLEVLLHDLEAQASAADKPAISALRHVVSARRSFKDVLIRIKRDERTHSWNVAGKPLFDENDGFIGYRGLCTDVTDREEYRRRIEFAAKHDYLTESYNRSTFLEYLDSLSQSPAGTTSALLCVDLDEFKSVNDEFGHAMGDNLLKAVVKRIHSCVRSEDRVFRLGGDEFAVALPGGDRDLATAIASRIIERISMPFNFGSTSIRIGASIGIALIDPRGASGHIVHKSADLALYRAKSEGRATFRFADNEFDTALEHGVALERDLSHALSRHQLALMYQPIVELSSGIIASAEVLLRWTHPVLGAVPPKVFIPLLEQSGEIAEVGAFVIMQAIEAAAHVPHDVRLAINLSPVQLTDSGLRDLIGQALAVHAVPAAKIEFEITETTLLDGDVDKQGVLAAIQELGCRVCLDDFGTGHASLRVLEEFPFDKVKIDGSFINVERKNQRQRHILEAMIQLGRNLDVTVTGEGVETREQLEELMELGCVEGQGFFLFEPMKFDELVGVILQNGSLRPKPSPVAVRSLPPLSAQVGQH